MTGEDPGWPVQDGVLELGDLPVERGGVIRDARLVWQAHGTLNDARDNVIVYPCSYTAVHDDLAWLIGPDAVLDPVRWFIVVPDMFSNGLSSSAADTADYPAVVTMADNVLRPMLIGKKAKLPVLFLFFSILGGLAAYGLIGLFLGPILLAILLTAIQIYREEYLSESAPPPPMTA